MQAVKRQPRSLRTGPLFHMTMDSPPSFATDQGVRDICSKTTWAATHHALSRILAQRQDCPAPSWGWWCLHCCATCHPVCTRSCSAQKHLSVLFRSSHCFFDWEGGGIS